MSMRIAVPVIGAAFVVGGAVALFGALLYLDKMFLG